MPTINYKVVVNDEELQLSRQSVIDYTEELDKRFEEVEKQITDAFKQAGESTDKYNKKVKEMGEDTDKATKMARAGLVAQIKDYKVLGISINDINAKIAKMIGVQRGLNTAVGGGTKAWKAFKVAMFSTGIGAFVVLAGSLVTMLAKTQKGIDFVSKAMAALGEVFSTVFDTYAKLGAGLVKLFKGDLSGALDEVKAAGEEFAGVGEDAVAAWNLEGATQAIRDEALELRKTVALTRSEIKALNKDAEDTTKSFSERESAARRAFELEQGLVTKRLELANREIAVLEQQQALGENLYEDNEEYIALIEQREALSQESLELQTTLQNKLNTINQTRIAQLEKERQEIDKLRQEYDKIAQDVDQRIKDIEFEKLNPLEQLKKEFSIAKDTLQAELDAAIELGKKLGKNTQGIQEAYAELFKLIEEDYTKRIGELEIKVDAQVELGEIKTVGALPPADEIVPETVKAPKLTVEFAEVKIDSKIGRALTKVTGEIGKFFESEEFQAAFGAATQVGDAFATIFDAQIAGLEALNAQRQERIDELQESIELEEELQREGSRNIIADKEAELNELLTLQEETNKEINEKRKQQIAIETAQAIGQQVASTGVAIAKVFEAHSGIPFVGVALAAGFVATMIATIASANSQIKQLTALSTGAARVGDYFGDVATGYGTDRISGREDAGLRVVHRNGMDTGIRLGGEERIVTGKTNAAIGDIIQYMEENPSRTADLRAWFLGMDTSPQLATVAANVMHLHQPQGMSEQAMEKAFTMALDKYFEKYTGYHDSIPQLFFEPEAAGKLHVRKNGRNTTHQKRPRRKRS